jgi:hypothetical protein
LIYVAAVSESWRLQGTVNQLITDLTSQEQIKDFRCSKSYSIGSRNETEAAKSNKKQITQESSFIFGA